MNTATRTRAALTKLDPDRTIRRPGLRTGRQEIWEAVSADGRWLYHRLEGEPGTPWLITDQQTPGAKTEWFGSLPAARRWTAEQPAPTRPAVIDCAAYAWTNCAQECLEPLADDFVADYRDLLDETAAAAMAALLPIVWAEHGYQMTAGTAEEMAREIRELPDLKFWAVWDEAARRIDTDSLVVMAGLDVEYGTYRD